MSKTPSFTVGIVGATGAAGQELLRLLQARRFPIARLRFSPRRVPPAKLLVVAISYRGGGGEARRLCRTRPGFFRRRSGVTRALAPDAVRAGCLVIDKSSAFRLDPACPW